MIKRSVVATAGLMVLALTAGCSSSDRQNVTVTSVKTTTSTTTTSTTTGSTTSASTTSTVELVEDQPANTVVPLGEPVELPEGINSTLTIHVGDVFAVDPKFWSLGEADARLIAEVGSVAGFPVYQAIAAGSVRITTGPVGHTGGCTDPANPCPDATPPPSVDVTIVAAKGDQAVGYPQPKGDLISLPTNRGEFVTMHVGDLFELPDESWAAKPTEFDPYVLAEISDGKRIYQAISAGTFMVLSTRGGPPPDCDDCTGAIPAAEVYITVVPAS